MIVKRRPKSAGHTSPGLPDPSEEAFRTVKIGVYSVAGPYRGEDKPYYVDKGVVKPSKRPGWPAKIGTKLV